MKSDPNAKQEDAIEEATADWEKKKKKRRRKELRQIWFFGIVSLHPLSFSLSYCFEFRLYLKTVRL